ncbi:MAG: hypothetical protein UZ15_CFX003002503 [Chloroflexi bacterium OLB15]|nr:MAG: hypothetical protein UZ15_CFX003002503 [Chloroflexi bacterium OLB15]
MTTDAIIAALIIFLLRIVNNGIGTIRLIVMARQQRTITVILAFFEALTFAITIAAVATDLSNLLNLAAYCVGFAAGNWVGMALEARFIVSYVRINIFAKTHGKEIADELRKRGFGVTAALGTGHEGPTEMLHAIATRRDVPQIVEVVNDINPSAFTFVEEARAVNKGYIRRQQKIDSPQGYSS